MIQNQQIIRLGDQSEEEADQMPHSHHQQQNQSTEQPISQLSREEQPNIFQAIERYLEQHCCIKFLLFLIIILLIVAVYQEKGYLIKKQRTFKFFIEKIQKEKIKKQLISETQDKNGQNVVEPEPPQIAIQNNLKKSQQAQLETAKKSGIIAQVNKSTLNSTERPKNQVEKQRQIDEKYSSIQGITMSKIVQAARWRNLKNEDILMHSDLSNEEQSYYQQKYRISHYEELPFCIVVPTYNNADNNRHISNIRSIVMQNYHNYRIVVINDASTDQSAQEILSYLQMQSKVKPSNFIFTNNSENQGSSRNIRRAAFENCEPNQILMIVDGDDELIGRQVLKLFNVVYQETGAWMVYSNFFTEEGKLGYSKPMPDRVMQASEYRKYPFVVSHLRTLYTQLLREIKEEDLQGKDGKYLKAANDVSILLPCLEMAHRRVIYIPELTYMYNQKTGLNNHELKLLEQKRNERYIRQKTPYVKLESLLDGNTTLGVNSRDELLADPEKLQWFRQALAIKSVTKDLGNIIDYFKKTL